MKISLSKNQSAVVVNENIQSEHNPKDLKATADLYPKLYYNLNKLLEEQAVVNKALQN